MSEHTYEKTGRYDDIIGLPYHQSKTRPHMSLHDRAAQFSPFAALKGYEEAIEETGRLTGEKQELDEESRMYLDQKLLLLEKNLGGGGIPLSVVYFVPDAYKTGGSVSQYSGVLHRIDRIEGTLAFEDGMQIRTDAILQLDSGLFSSAAAL